MLRNFPFMWHIPIFPLGKLFTRFTKFLICDIGDKYTGPTFTYSTGNAQLLCITDPEMVKHISLCTSLSLGKPSFLAKERKALFGSGILTSSGANWAYQKKIIAPELHMDKVKVNLFIHLLP